MSVTPSPIKNGWAVKAKKKSKRFSAAVKDVFFEEFIRGVETGRKENPGLVSRKIKARFPHDDWLTTQQVARYFSRLACQEKCGHLTKYASHSDDQHQLANRMMTRSSLRTEVIQQVDL